MAIPFSIAPFSSGQVIGFDVQVNDDGTGDGKRTGIANWNDLTGMGYTSTAGYGALKLTGDRTETGTTTTTGGGTTTVTTTKPTNVTYGDVNLDGKVDLTDAITMNKYMAGVIAELTPVQFANANCDISDGTNTVNEADATALLNFVIMLEKVLPVIGTN